MPSSTTRAHRRLAVRPVATLLAVLAVLVASLGTGLGTAASAAPAAPQQLTTTTSGVLPVFSWQAVSGATKYAIELTPANQSAQRIETTNLSYVPRQALPEGVVAWRVQAADAADAWGAWSSSTFTQAARPGPTLGSPTDGAAIAPPAGGIQMTWDPVPGAESYVVQYSRDSGFGTGVVTEGRNTASFVATELPAPGTYYWRVQGRLPGNINTAWSTVRSFVYGQLPSVTRIAPAENATVQDAVLSWNPVPGARAYDLQISTDVNFTTLEHDATVFSTSYARPRTLDNDQYYWRVRARDARDNVQDWSSAAVWTFERNWPDQPELTYPADQARVGDQLYFEWDPVPHASKYRIEFSPSSNFGTIWACETTATTFVPSTGACMPGAEETRFWRVIALDEFASPAPVTASINAEVRRFTYAPSLITPTAPAQGATVTLPRFQWEPHPGAARYRVTITSLDGGPSIDVTTPNPWFVPRSRLTAGNYRWDVVWVSQDDRSGGGLLPASEPTFTVQALPDGSASRPQPISPLIGTFDRFPTLRWDHVANADRYRVEVRLAGTLAWSDLGVDFRYPAGEDLGSTYLNPGTYEWRALAIEAGGNPIDYGNVAQFTIAAPDAVTGYEVGITNAGVDAGETCDATLPDRCANLRQNPVLTWDADPEVGYYKLYIARDANLTSFVSGYNGVPVFGTRFSPTGQFDDSQAGSAYFWTVVPCKYATACAPLSAATHAFAKKSNPVSGLAPGVAVGATPLPEVANDVTLTWDDYLLSNTSAAQGDSVLTTRATLEAQRYRVELSTDPNFVNATWSHGQEVDQTRFTPFGVTIPEGPIYWRVRAFDGSDKALNWSETRAFRKVSPAPALVSPAQNAVANGNLTLTWQAQAFAAGYDVQVFRNNDQLASDGNKVVEAGTQQVAWSWSQTLPVSDQPYAWRVRRRDGENRPGPWSAWGSFRVVATTPALSAPTSGATVHPRWTRFVWTAVPGARLYRFERRTNGSVSSTDTQALSYAPEGRLPDGTSEWRVVPLDANGAAMVPAADQEALWQAFSSTSAPAATQPPVVFGSPEVGAVLSSSAPTWSLGGVTLARQWLRDGNPISGATGASYTVTREDLGKSIRLQATGSLGGYDPGVSVSNAVSIAAGPAPTLGGAFLIGGTGQVGTSIAPTTPPWNEPGVSTSLRWIVDGNDVGNGGDPLTLGPGLIGRSVVLQAVGRRDGYSDAVVQSNPITVVTGGAPGLLAPVTVTGTPKVGESLATNGGTWSAEVSRSYQWLVDGAPVPGETGDRYRVRPGDAARAVSVAVTVRRDGYAGASSTSAPVSVARMASTTELALSATSVTRKEAKKVTASVTVRVEGLEGPTGTLTVYDGKKVVAKVGLSASRTGQATIRLKKLKKGKHKLKAVYTGTTAITGSTSKIVKLTVRR